MNIFSVTNSLLCYEPSVPVREQNIAKKEIMVILSGRFWATSWINNNQVQNLNNPHKYANAMKKCGLSKNF